MSFVFHGLIVLIYFGISLAAAFALPQAMPELGTDIAMFLAGGILVVSTLLHQGMTHAARIERYTAELRQLKESAVALQAELRGARSELKELAERPLMAADPLTASETSEQAEGSAAASLLGRCEIDILKTLFKQLPRSSPATPAANDAEDDAPFELSGSVDERLAVMGAAAAPSERAATAQRVMTGESDYRRHLVADRPATRRDGPERVSPDESDAAVLVATRDAL